MAIVRLIYFLYRDILQVLNIAAILLGLLGIAYDQMDGLGRPNRLLRRMALAIALGLVGAIIYAVIPIALDRYGITPQPGHIKFYGLFFPPAGFLAGILAVVYGAQRRLFAPPAGREPGLFSWQGYLVGVVVLWLVFFLYSRIFLNPGILSYALVRSSVTAPIGALLFAPAPFLVHRADNHVAGLFSTFGFLLVAAGLIVELLLRMSVFFHADLL